ncbi:hypothetical protein BGW36DRAFT_365678 [Talaromyces proteolyticus]|uniref:Uncharacterized protein n=1 Tax=Talaromyces proteolyticus TaxID=1131652 RepID=A0AAD4PRM0_9EURO|nr:uncharacterized protein BGW36DRAFT_365678 [Talaromyces proteolyticus]KAH8689147.1 hypothetical protein BGW36DRAFT_365678 [Talaromyces proteolyticus]
MEYKQFTPETPFLRIEPFHEGHTTDVFAPEALQYSEALEYFATPPGIYSVEKDGMAGVHFYPTNLQPSDENVDGLRIRYSCDPEYLELVVVFVFSNAGAFVIRQPVIPDEACAQRFQVKLNILSMLVFRILTHDNAPFYGAHKWQILQFSPDLEALRDNANTSDIAIFVHEQLMTRVTTTFSQLLPGNARAKMITFLPEPSILNSHLNISWEPSGKPHYWMDFPQITGRDKTGKFFIDENWKKTPLSNQNA